jgi:hypothetical protein
MNLNEDTKFSLFLVAVIIVVAILFRELTKGLGTLPKLQAGAWLSLAGLVFSLVVTAMTLKFVKDSENKGSEDSQKKAKTVNILNIIYVVLLGIATLQAIYLMYQLYTQTAGNVAFGF